MGLSRPAAGPENRTDLAGQGTCAHHVRPERPRGQPTRGRATAVPAAVPDPCASALVAELAVELDQDALLRVGDVVPLRPSGIARVLSQAVRQPVCSFDIAEIAQLHGALCAAGDISEHLPQQCASRVA